jgi:hypothetical protein
MSYYKEIEVDDNLLAVEVDDSGEADVYCLMSDREPSGREWECAMEHLQNEGVLFNDEGG